MNRTVLAVAATAGMAAIALLAVLRSSSRTGKRQALYELDRWDSEGGNIPEVSVGSGEQGSTPEQDPQQR